MRLLLLGFLVWVALSQASEFRICEDKNCFLKDGKCVQLVSGSVHYYNVPYQLWEDRLQSTRNCGVNTVQTYLEWRTLEPTEGLFDFTGQNNFVDFIKTAQKVGLMVNLRLGPYIDSEREMGGLPWWLLKINPNMKLRSNDADFMKYTTRYWSNILPLVKPLLYSNGGPVVLVQIENEYGSFGACDYVYTSALRDLAIQYLGEDIIYYTVDGPQDQSLACGKNEGVYSTVDFGPRQNITANFAAQRRHQRYGPLVNSEYYTGWLDRWGEAHHTGDIKQIVSEIDQMLAMNASVNMYMFHGGTHFGFDNGANLDPGFRACMTSYDYDAPLNEAGDPTDKCQAVKDVVKKYMDVPSENVSPKPKMKLDAVSLKKVAGLNTMLNSLKTSLKGNKTNDPISFEQLDHPYGLAVYETTLDFQPSIPSVLKVPGLRDRGYVFVDNKLQGILSRDAEAFQLPIRARKGQNIDIVVENMGRVCFGEGINDQKGIIQPVTLGSKDLKNWLNIPIPDTEFGLNMKYRIIDRADVDSPEDFGVFKGTFDISQTKINTILDTFLRFDGWNKGFVFVNGVNLGRYWPIQGPQITLYLPGVYLKYGTNNITVVELEGAPENTTIAFTDVPQIDGPFATY